jgi:hypothetical protein
MKAFPLKHGIQEKMDLRDYFAAKAMQSFINETNYEYKIDEVIAKDAYKIADAMMKARLEK